jgi:hypothetical protein
MPEAEDAEDTYGDEKLAYRHRLAAEIVALLPEDRDEAEAVLELADTILWIVPQPPARLPARPTA